MHRRRRPIALVAVLAACVTVSGACGDDDDSDRDRGAGRAAEEAEWGYEGGIGPQSWAGLSPVYATCGEGSEQSPIDLGAAERGGVPPLELDYAAAPATQLNNGHTIEYELEGAGGIRLGGERYELSQFHFHAPAEHEAAGTRFDMELHLVHTDDRERIAVLAVLIRAGEENPAFEELLAKVPAQEGQEREIEAVDAAALLPLDRERYSYAGSLTTPPCSEGVRWTVLREPIELSAAQIARFTEVYEGNNRPLQELGERKVELGS